MKQNNDIYRKKVCNEKTNTKISLFIPILLFFNRLVCAVHLKEGEKVQPANHHRTKTSISRKKAWYERTGSKLSIFLSIFCVLLFLVSGLNGISRNAKADWVTVGSGGSDQFAPFDVSKGYATCAALYLANNIGKPGKIVSLTWQRYYKDVDTINNLIISLKQTTATSLSSSSLSTWSELNGTVVYAGNFGTTDSTTQWEPSITLTTPFQYDGVSNLIVGVKHFDRTGESPESWYRYTTGTSMFRTLNSTTAIGDSSTLTLSNNVPNIDFQITPNIKGPMLKSPLESAKVNTKRPTLTWYVPRNPDNNSMHFIVEIATSPGGTPVITANSSASTAGFNAGYGTVPPISFASKKMCNYTLQSDLTNSTTYYWRVRAVEYGDWSKRGDWSSLLSEDWEDSFASGRLSSDWSQNGGSWSVVTNNTQVLQGNNGRILYTGSNGMSGLGWSNYTLEVKEKDASNTLSVGSGYYTMQSDPLNITDNYHCDGALYLSSEIGQSGKINRISWFRTSLDSDNVKNVSIYMREITDTDLTGASYNSWTNLINGATLVWVGNLTLDGSSIGWYPTITLNTPFIYSETKNLLVCMRHQDGSKEATSSLYQYTSIPNMYQTGTSSSNPPSVSLSSKRPNIQFQFNDDVGRVLFRTGNPTQSTYSIYQNPDGKLYLCKNSSAGGTWNYTTAFAYNTEKIYKIEVNSNNNLVKIRLTYNGIVAVSSWTDSSGWWTDTLSGSSCGLNGGGIGFEAHNCTARFDEIYVYPGIWSFTVDTSITEPTWFQTTGRQFNDTCHLSYMTTRFGSYQDAVLSLPSVQVGTGTSTQAPPLDISANYHCDGALYLASEIGRSGTIRIIKWYRSTADSDTLNTATIYMREVNDTDLSGTNYNTVAKLQTGTLVYSGNVVVDGSTTGWYPTITLTTPFVYDGLKNLLVSFRDQDGSKESSYSKYQYSTATNMFRTGSSSSNPPSIGSATSTRPNIQFGFDATGTITSEAIRLSDISPVYYSWKIFWTEVSGGGVSGASDVTVKMQYWNTTSFQWSDSLGSAFPAVSSSTSPIIINTTNTALTVRLVATLTQGTNSTSPILRDWAMKCLVKSFPYEINMESDDFWTHGIVSGTDNWARGIPTSGPKSDHTTGSMTSAWAPSLAGTPSANSEQWLRTPIIQIPSGLCTGNNVTLSFWQWYSMGSGDSAVVEESTDGGVTWSKTLLNLYSNTDNSRWEMQVITITLDSVPANIMLRFKLTTDSSTSGTQWYIDDFKISYSVNIEKVYSYGSGTGEKVVLYNYGAMNVSISGWNLYKSSGVVSGTWSGTVITPGGEVTFTSTSGTNNWVDTGDAVILKDNSGQGVDFMRYGTSTTIPPINLQWTGTNPSTTPANATQYLYRAKETVFNNPDTDDGADWVIWKDSNGDGVPDWWATKYSLTGQNLATHDANNNGISDLNEYLNNLDPTAGWIFSMPVTLSTGLSVNSGMNLRLNRSTLTFNCGSDGSLALNVASGGNVMMFNSTVTSSSTAKRPKFIVQGYLRMNDSSVSNLWSAEYLKIGGLQINSTNVFINRSTAMNSFIGYYFYNANALIWDSKTANVTYGMVVNNSSPKIIRASVESNLTGILVQYSGQYLRIESCTIHTLNGDSIFMTGSQGLISNSTLKSEGGAGLNSSGAVHFTILDSVVSGSTYGMYTSIQLGRVIYVTMCTINGTKYGMYDSGGIVMCRWSTINSIENSSVIIDGASPYFINCTLSAGKNSSLRCHGASPILMNCTLLAYDYALYLEQSTSSPILDNVNYDHSKFYTDDHTDNDSDGQWNKNETYKYGLNPNVSDVGADTDGDGITNIDEVDKYHSDYSSNTDPMNSSVVSYGQMDNTAKTLFASGNSTQHTMVFDRNGTLHLVYVWSDSSGDQAIKYQKSSDGGLNWTEPITITNGTINPAHVSLGYDNGTDMLTVAWEEDNTYDASKPVKFIKYMTAKPTSSLDNPFTYPKFLWNGTTTDWTKCSSRTNVNVTDNQLKLNFTVDTPTETLSSTGMTKLFVTTYETYGQTFTATKSFVKVGLYASSNGDNIGTLHLALYDSVQKNTCLGCATFVNYNDNSYLDFSISVLPAGTYYLEWTTSDASKGVGAMGTNPGTYSGGTGYYNGVSQSYDFRMRFYQITPCSSGQLISRAYEGVWYNKQHMLTQRQGPAGAMVNGTIWAFGGWGNGTTLNSIEMYNPVTNMWHNGYTGMPTARYHLGGIAINGLIYAIGGRDFGTYYDNLEVYNPQTNTWTAKAPMPIAHVTCAVVEVNGILYAIGGSTSTNALNVVEAYCPANNTWWNCRPMSVNRDGCMAVVIDGLIYVFGGRDGSTYYSKVEVYNPATNSWSSNCAPMPWPRAWGGATEIDGIAYIIEGYYGAWANEVTFVNAYNPKNNTWWTLPNGKVARGAFAEMGIATFDKRIYVFGGAKHDVGTFDNNEMLDLAPSLKMVTVKWDATVPTGTTLVVQVSNDNGTSWVSASNRQISYFARANCTLVYRLFLNSTGINTPIVNWIQLDQSSLDYGVNPSVAGGMGDIYIAYQKTSYNHVNNYNITFAKSTYNGTAWNYTSFSGSSYSGETGMSKIVQWNSRVYIVSVSKNSGTSEMRSYTSYDRGNTWASYVLVNAAIVEMNDPTQFSFTMMNGKGCVAYSHKNGSYYVVFTKYTNDTGTNLMWSSSTTQSSTQSDSKNPNVKIDSLGNLYLTWMQSSTDLYIKSTNASGSSTNMVTIKLASGCTELEFPSIAMDSSNYIHVLWKEKLGNNESIMYWDNTPQTPQAITDALNTYLGQLPDSSFKDNAAIRRCALETKVTTVANEGNNGWLGTALSSGKRAYFGASSTSDSGTGNNIYSIGGYDGTNVLARTEAYNPISHTEWSCTDMPTARKSLGVAEVNGIIYAIGGIKSDGTTTGKCEAYSPSTNSWNTNLASMPTARSNFGCAVCNGIIYTFGGLNSVGNPVDCDESYNPSTNSWSTLNPQGTARYNPTAVELNGLIYVMGGKDSYGTYQTLTAIYRPSTHDFIHTLLSDYLPVAKMGAGGASLNGFVYLFGGRTSDSPTDVKTVNAYSPLNRTWWSCPSMNYERYCQGSCVLNGKFYAIGGYSTTVGDYLSSLEEYTPAYTSLLTLTSPWTTRNNMPIGARGYMGAASTGGNVYCIGGYDGSNFLARSQAYNPVNDTWWTCTDMPHARAGVGVVSYNGLIYAIGGNGATGVSSKIDVYDPIRNTWTTKNDMITGRTWANSVEVNGVIYTIGGSAVSWTGVNTVEAYTPATDTWRSCMHMQTARYGAAACAINGIIYVAGGLSTSNGPVISSVEAYNPTTDTWSYVQSLSQAMWFHNGAELYGNFYAIGGITGTMDSNSYTNIMKIYDPVSNVWSDGHTMSYARGLAAACACNGKIYVIGGINPTVGYCKYNEEYNPGNALQALQMIQYSILPKVDMNKDSWITNPVSNEVLISQFDKLASFSQSIIPPVKRGTQFGGAIDPSEWYYSYGVNVDTSSSNYPSVYLSGSVGVFQFKGIGGSVPYAEFINHDLNLNPISIDKYSMLSTEFGATTGIFIRLTVRVGTGDPSNPELTGYIEGIGTSVQSYATSNIFAMCGIGSDSPYYSKTLTLNCVWVMMTGPDTGTNWQSGYLGHLFIGPSALKEGFNENEVKNWYYMSNGVSPSSDGDVAYLYTNQLLTGATWYYKSLFSGIDPPILLNNKQIYWKFKTDTGTEADIQFHIQGEYNGNLWSGLIHPFKGQQQEDSSGPICTNGQWQIRTILWDNIGDIISYSGSHLIDTSKNIWITGISISTFHTPYTSQRDRNLWIDYLYISEDLDNDGAPDINSFNVNGDSISNNDAVTYGAFRVFKDPIDSVTPTPIGLGFTQCQATFSGIGSIQGFIQTFTWIPDGHHPWYADDYYDPFECNPQDVPFVLPNAANYLDTPTDLTRQVVHPSIIHFTSIWPPSSTPDIHKNFEYWMAITPYIYADGSTENPSILASHDGKTWEVPSGLTNPLMEYKNEVGCDHLDDPELVYDASSQTLYFYWAAHCVDPSSYPGFIYQYVAFSTDGIHWNPVNYDSVNYESYSGEIYKLNSYKDPLSVVGSPSVIYDNLASPKWNMWGVYNPPNAQHYLRYSDSTDGITWTYEPSSQPIMTGTDGLESDGKALWHISIKKVTDTVHTEYWGLNCQEELGHGGLLGWTKLYFTRSIDKIHWISYNTPILSPTGPGNWDSAFIYRSSFTVEKGSSFSSDPGIIPDHTYIRVWYSADKYLGWKNPMWEWHLGYTYYDLTTILPTWGFSNNAYSDNYCTP